MKEKFFSFYRRYGEIIRYIIVGVFTTLIGWGVFYGLSFIYPPTDGSDLGELWNTVSWVAAVVFSYFAGRKFVYGSGASTTAEMLSEFSAFALSRVFSLLLEDGLIFLLKISGVPSTVSKIPISAVVVICNYITGKIVFGRRKKTKNGKNLIKGISEKGSKRH